MLNGTLQSVPTGTAGLPSSNVLTVQGIPGGSPVAIQSPGTPVVQYGVVTLVPANVETTIVSYVVPVGKTFYGAGFVASGNSHGLYRIYFNGTAVLSGRSSTAVPTMDLSFKMATPTATAGQTIAVKITHYAGSTADFEGTILGYIL
jgi:hypothetical protein